MGKLKFAIKPCMAGMLLMLALVLSGWNSLKADENGKLEYEVVHTYDELLNYFAGDDSFYSFKETPRTKYSDYWGNGEMIQVDESWSVEINEPGWLIFTDYNNYPDGNYSYAKPEDAPFTYLYSNKLRTKPVNRVLYFYGVDGEGYTRRSEERYYVQQGTYYLDYTGQKKYWNNCMLCVAFLPAKDIISVNEIKYNADYTAATVTFTVASDMYSSVAYTDQKINSFEALGDRSYWKNWLDNNNNYYYTDENGVQQYEYGAYGINTKRFLERGWTITANGEYSVYCEIENGPFAYYQAIVNFKIDKIGANVAVKSLKLKKSKATMKVGSLLTLDATIKPKDATDKTITWKSSNSKVARVDENGNVTAVKKGTCTITATTSNGKKAKCKITVKK